jgi:chitobiase/beta-hexosaminidase-like protein/centrosomal CEP192-like protein
MITLAFPVSGKSFCSFLLSISFFLAIFLSIPVVTAQTQQQPFLFASTTVNGQEAVVTFLRDETSGVLTLLPATPMPFAHQCLPEAIDQQSPPQFLFGVCADGVAMYTFDPTSGAVAEVTPGSPYTASTTGNSVYTVTEATGQYVYLIKVTEPDANGDSQFILDQFQIIRGAAPSLNPSSSQTLPYWGQTGGIYADPNSHGIAIYTTVSETQVPTLFLITFDPATGVANIPTVGTAFPGIYANSLAGSPRGDSIVAASSATAVLGPGASGTVTVLSLSTTTFEITNSATLPVDATWPYQVFFGPAGKLFYVQYAAPSSQGPAPFHIYATSTLTELSTSPISFADWQTIFENICDPNGNFVYATNGNSPGTGVQVYFVDPGTGYPSQSGPLTSPFGQAYVLKPIFATMAGNGGGQPSSGPMLSLNAISLNFGQITEGQTSAPLAVTLSSVGNEAVSLVSIAITGPNAGDFTESDTCMSAPVLAPQQTCSVSVTYRPLGVGTRQAALSITDNSPGSPQIIPLAGTSVAPPTPIPIASFTPAGTFNIPGTVTVGMTSSPQNLLLTNTGSAPMHVTNIVLGGINVNDFSLGTSTCVGTLAVNSNCSIPIIFAPVAAGIRSSTITVTDDAPASPQVVVVNGTAAQPVSIGAAGSGSTSAAVTAGQTAQFLLQATPGPGFTGTLSFTCTGQPFGAVCTVPPNVTISGGTATPLTISVSTLASGAATPEVLPPSAPLQQPVPWPPLTVAGLLAILLACCVRNNRYYRILVPPLNTVRAVLLAVLLVFSGIGCGGGSSQTTPPPQQEQQPQPQAATPSLLPAGGTFSGAQSITMSDTTAGATIYYTTDGTTPTASSLVYSGPIPLNSATTVQAIASAASHTASTVASANYKFRTPAGNYTVTVIPTVTAAGSSKSWQLNAISLTLVVN